MPNPSGSSEGRPIPAPKETRLQANPSMPKPTWQQELDEERKTVRNPLNIRLIERGSRLWNKFTNIPSWIDNHQLQVGQVGIALFMAVAGGKLVAEREEIGKHIANHYSNQTQVSVSSETKPELKVAKPLPTEHQPKVPYHQLFLENYTYYEKGIAQQRVEEEVKRIENQHNNKERVAQTGKWLSLIEKIVDDPKIDIKAEDREKKIRMTLATIFVESSGHPHLEAHQTTDQITPFDNPDETIDQGLTQIKKKVARPIAKKLGLEDNFQLKDPETNIRIYLGLQKYLEDRFGNLAPLVHNWGEGNTTRAIEAYEKGTQKRLISEIDRVLTSNAKFGTKELVDQDQISAVKLVEPEISPSSTSILKANGLKEGNLNYYYYLLAADEILQKNARLIQTTT